MDYRSRNRDVLSSLFPSLFLCYLFGRSHPSNSRHQWIWGRRWLGLRGHCYGKRRGNKDTVIYCFSKTEPLALRWCCKPADLQFCWKGTKSQRWNGQTATKCFMSCPATWTQKGRLNSKTAIDPTSTRSVTADDSVRDQFNCLNVYFYGLNCPKYQRYLHGAVKYGKLMPFQSWDRIPRTPPRTINPSNWANGSSPYCLIACLVN